MQDDKTVFCYYTIMVLTAALVVCHLGSKLAFPLHS